MNRQDLGLVLKGITFAPSCLDMGWGWEVKDADALTFGGWLIRTTFRRPDTHTGEIGTGNGRWWFVGVDADDSSVVKTAWLACKQIVEHELMEAFLFEGARVFNPHANIYALHDLHRTKLGIHDEQD
jgi:hypothetical protein